MLDGHLTCPPESLVEAGPPPEGWNHVLLVCRTHHTMEYLLRCQGEVVSGRCPHRVVESGRFCRAHLRVVLGLV